MKSNVGLFLQKRAQLNPSLEAFIDTHSNRRLSFADLDARANRTAHFLARELGVRKGDRVALLMMNSPEFLESFFAIAKLGAVCVPLNWRLVPDELQFILKDSGAKTLLYGGEFAQAVAELEKRGPATDVKHWVHQGADATRAKFALDYDALQRAASTEAPACTACDDDLLYIMYTSGHDRPAEGRRAHPRDRDVGRAHDRRDRRDAAQGPLPGFAAVLPRRRADADHAEHLQAA